MNVRKSLQKIKEGISEQGKWMKKAVKQKGKLRADLGVKDDQDLYDVSASKVVKYAQASRENMSRVVLARTFAQKRKAPMGSKEKSFWASVSSKLKA